MFKIAFASALLVITSGMLAQTPNTDAGNPELARIQSEYSDVLALQGIAKAELLAIARVLRAKPEMANDRSCRQREVARQRGSKRVSLTSCSFWRHRQMRMKDGVPLNSTVSDCGIIS